MSTSKLQDALFASGLIEKGNLEEIQAFKKRFRADYLKQFGKQYGTGHVRKEITFTHTEFDYLSSLAKEHDLRVNTFLKAIIFAYLQDSYVFTQDSQIQKLEKYQQIISNQVLSLAKYIHTSEEITRKEFDEILELYHGLEKGLSQILRNPPRLEKWLQQQIQTDSEFLSKLFRALSNYHSS